MQLYLIKIKNALYFLIFLIINILLKKKTVKTNSNTLLLIRLDSIGDYVLFRNFIEISKNSKKYKNYSITLCGNIIWKDISEDLDKDFVDEFIWIDRGKFYGNIFYKYKILKQVREKGFEIVIDSIYSREILYGDSLVKVSGAKEKIGSIGSLDSHSKWKRNLFTDKYFTKLIPSNKENIFEFDRNKEFFGQLLNEKIELKKSFIDVSNVSSEKLLASPYIVIFPGAKHLNRRWNTNSFAEISGLILTEYDFNIVIAGSKDDYKPAEVIAAKTKSDKIINLAGKTTLSELSEIISKADLLISNDTGAVHIAAAVSTPFICVSNGNHFGRFHPYPKEIFEKAYYVYPPEIMNNLHDIELLKEKYRFKSDLDINEIEPQTVKEVIRKIMKLQ